MLRLDRYNLAITRDVDGRAVHSGCFPRATPGTPQRATDRPGKFIGLQLSLSGFWFHGPCSSNCGSTLVPAMITQRGKLDLFIVTGRAQSFHLSREQIDVTSVCKNTIALAARCLANDAQSDEALERSRHRRNR